METILFIVGAVILIVYFSNQKNKNIQKLKEDYERALKGKDKRVALNAGRAYYQALKGRYGISRMAFGTSLTAADEIAIMNEINTMM